MSPLFITISLKFPFIRQIPLNTYSKYFCIKESKKACV